MIRCVVLDLDDTLLDTSGPLVPRAHREAARALIASGLQGDVDRVGRLRMRAARVLDAGQVDGQVCRLLGQSTAGIAGAGERAFYNRGRNLGRGGELRLLPGAREVLRRLHLRTDLILMTSGVTSTQRVKIECLRIERYFSQVVVLERGAAGGKTAALRDILRRSVIPPHEFLMVGDDWGAEILAGTRLGTRTCWINRGEGRHRRRWPPLTPDAVIGGPRGLPEVIDRLNRREQQEETVRRQTWHR